MKTIINDDRNEIVIKNSRFICYLYKVRNIFEIDAYLDNIRMIEKDATHYCYAYVLNGYQKCSDDGEPGNTAGMPILNVLLNNEMENVLCIVVRYFGGIKLGAGGLIRAYTKSVTSTLNNENMICLVNGYRIAVEFDYGRIKEMDYLFRNFRINKKEFIDVVRYEVEIPDYLVEKIKGNGMPYLILEKILIETNVTDEGI